MFLVDSVSLALVGITGYRALCIGLHASQFSAMLFTVVNDFTTSHYALHNL